MKRAMQHQLANSRIGALPGARRQPVGRPKGRRVSRRAPCKADAGLFTVKTASAQGPLFFMLGDTKASTSSLPNRTPSGLHIALADRIGQLDADEAPEVPPFKASP
jgi:hypothetical protein